MPVTLHGRDQLRQKRNEPFATHIIDRAPCRDQGGLDRGAVSTDPAARFLSGAVRPSEFSFRSRVARFRWNQVEFQGLIEDALLLRSRRILVSNRRS